MPTLPPPSEIRRLGARAVRIVWADGHASEYLNNYLREHCPCAACRGTARNSLPIVADGEATLYPVQIGLVGRYAVSVEWSDGHDTGIYSYQTLRQLCPCEACLAGAATGIGAT
ncbi:MAG: DUF971 domain-containing protein [bacterium]